MSRPRKDDLPWHRICTHPGCKTIMSKGSHTYDVGLCAKHGGARVGRAERKPMIPVAPKPARPNVRVAEVATGGSGYSGAESGMVRVSLPREPWA